jgi:hypothetical protein
MSCFRSRSAAPEILKSYFYWTYPRGCFHYDVMVTLILAVHFCNAALVELRRQAVKRFGPVHPIQVVGDGESRMIVTVQASDVCCRRARRTRW